MPPLRSPTPKRPLLPPSSPWILLWLTFCRYIVIALCWSTNSWKSHGYQSPHVPPCVDQAICVEDHTPTHLHVPLHIWVVSLCASMHRAFKSRAFTHFHAPQHFCWLHSTTLALALSLMSLACISCWHHLQLSLTSGSWPLTFIKFDCWLSVGLIVDFFLELPFCSPSAPYPVFCVDLIFVVHFCILFI